MTDEDINMTIKESWLKDMVDTHNKYKKLEVENQQLKAQIKNYKELLRECKTPIDLLIKMNIDGINGYKLLDLLIKIDNAIGEKINEQR